MARRSLSARHTDAQYHPQPNELNFWVPLTDAYGSNSLYVESSAGVGASDRLNAAMERSIASAATSASITRSSI